MNELNQSRAYSKLKKQCNQTQKKLKEFEAYFQTIVKHSRDRVTVLDFDGVVVFSNQEFSTSLPLFQKGTSLFDCLSPLLHDEVYSTLRIVQHTKGIAVFEHEEVTPFGEIRRYKNELCPVFLADEVIGVTMFSVDVSDKLPRRILLSEVQEETARN